jgi:hypothetical protein
MQSIAYDLNNPSLYRNRQIMLQVLRSTLR